jgi:hypothetical protein
VRTTPRLARCAALTSALLIAACGSRTISMAVCPQGAEPCSDFDDLVSVHSSATGGAAGSGNTGSDAGGDADTKPPIPDKVDLLFMIDNSPSMADKQAVFAQMVGDLIGRLSSPACVDPGSGIVVAQPESDGSCVAGEREFEPIQDLHVGIISSSLGSHGASDINGRDVCPDPDPSEPSAHRNDQSHLLTRTVTNGVEGTVSLAAGFLGWAGSVDPSIVRPLESMVTGVGQRGCGYEAQLEAIYRFLSDPNPYATITISGKSSRSPGVSTLTGTDMVVLAQRRDFLRPDSLVAVIAITDEDDCSINDDDPQGFYALLPPGGPVGMELSLVFPGTSACQTNPNDHCCFNCGEIAAPQDCPPPAQDPACGTPLLRTRDPENLRCWQQKRRYGRDFLFPIQRYIDGFSSSQVRDRSGMPVANPLFGDRRPRDWVVVEGIVGVPWQDIAVDSGDLTKGYRTASALQNAWATILGDPSNPAGPVPPGDPHMVDSDRPRAGLPGPDSARDADPIGGHDWDTGKDNPPNADLEYACVFDLPAPVVCDPMNNNCDCSDATVSDVKKPLCQDASGAYGHIQYRGRAYPGLRELAVLKGIGQQGVVASICPAVVDPAQGARADFGYRPAISALMRRFRAVLRP